MEDTAPEPKELTDEQRVRRKKLEKARMKREGVYIKDQVIAARRLCYMVLKTDQGALIVKAEGLRLKARRDNTNRKLRSMPKEARFEAKLRNTFDIYDVDGSNYIDCEEFKALLKDLCIPVTPDELLKEFNKMDGDHNGEVSFDEFKKWHKNNGAEISKINRFARLKLKALKRSKSAQGNLDSIRAKRALVANALKKAADDARFEFRNKNPPIVIPAKKGKKKGKKNSKDKKELTTTNESKGAADQDAEAGVPMPHGPPPALAHAEEPPPAAHADDADAPPVPHGSSDGMPPALADGDLAAAGTSGGTKTAGGEDEPSTGTDDLIAAMQNNAIYVDGMNATDGHLSNGRAPVSDAEREEQLEAIKSQAAFQASAAAAVDARLGGAGTEDSPVHEGLTSRERAALDHFEADLLFHEVELHIREDCWL